MGVCMRMDFDTVSNTESDLKGIRLPIFDYSGRQVLAINKYNEKVEIEIQRLKSKSDAEARSSGWITNSRPPNVIYLNDNITCLKSVGKKIQEKLRKADILKVKDLVFIDKSPSEIRSLLTSISDKSSLSMNSITRLHRMALRAEPGSEPENINYLSSPNPFQARYGDRWEDEVKKLKSMKQYCCIKELVRHVDNKSREAFKGTKYEESYLFYHDALITMTDSDCIEWMRQEGILKRWILPELGLNDEIVITDNEGKVKRSTRYKGRPVGDCPEAMPQDNSLFRDLRTSFDTHIVLTCMLERDDPRRFSKATPKEIARCIEKLWNPETGVVPSSKRIIQDIQRLKENFLLVVEAEGAVVPGVCDHNGHRRKHAGVGRKHYKMHEDQSATPIDELDLHADCIDVCTNIYNNHLASWEEKNARRDHTS